LGECDKVITRFGALRIDLYNTDMFGIVADDWTSVWQPAKIVDSRLGILILLGGIAGSIARTATMEQRGADQHESCKSPG